MEEETQVCPKCQGELIVLKTGKTVCRTCGVTDGKNTVNIDKTNLPKPPVPVKPFKTTDIPSIQDKNDTVEDPKKPVYDITKTKPETLIGIGLLTMLLTLFFFDTTVCETEGYSSSCTHNIGLLNNKSNLISIGGFLFVGGCILLKNKNQ